MESADHRESSVPLPSLPERAPAVEYRRRRSRRHEHTPRLHRVCDSLTEALIYLTVVFGPWAFGTTQVWSTWVMNGAGHCLGALLVAKWVVRWRKGYQPGRWGDPVDQETDDSQPNRWTALVTRTLAALTILVLAYTVVSALNARATYYHEKRWFDYHECIQWLPHSYDSRSTWFVFWQYLALAWFFRALLDWLLTQTAKERYHLRHGTQEERADLLGRLPARLRRLLWVVCFNGTVLAVECILQRLSGTKKLLWLVEPRLNKTPESQFGPYAYRSNAAQYFNLVWPVCLAFWWWLHRHASRLRVASTRLGGDAQVLLLPCLALMAACPIVSASRGGAMAALGTAVGAGSILGVRRGGRVAGRRLPVIAFLAVGIAFGIWLGWSQLSTRFVEHVYCAPTNFTQKFSSLPLSAVASRTTGVDIVFVKTTNMTIYVQGKEVQTSSSGWGQPPPWQVRSGSRFIWIGALARDRFPYTGRLLAASFYNYALTPEEVKALSENGLGQTAALTPGIAYRSDFSSGTDDFTTSGGGVKLESGITTEPGETPWLKASRKGEPGVVCHRRRDGADAVGPGHRFRVSFKALSGSERDHYISAGWTPVLALGCPSRTLGRGGFAWS